jgi:hypothetical protein
MIVSDKYRCIYVRIPKTGSTSIEDTLKELDPDCMSSDNSIPPYGHVSLDWLSREIDPQKFKDYYVFTTVRNPYDWFISGYMDHYQYSMPYAETTWSMLTSGMRMPSPEIVNGDEVITAPLALTFIAMLQFWHHGDWMAGGKHKTIATQQAFIEGYRCDYVMRLESIDEDWKYISNVLGLPEVELPKKNAGSGGKVLLSKDAKDMVRTVFNKDFVTFNY